MIQEDNYFENLPCSKSGLLPYLFSFSIRTQTNEIMRKLGGAWSQTFVNLNCKLFISPKKCRRRRILRFYVQPSSKFSSIRNPGNLLLLLPIATRKYRASIWDFPSFGDVTKRKNLQSELYFNQILTNLGNTCFD